MWGILPSPGALGGLISPFINGLSTYCAQETLSQALYLWQLLFKCLFLTSSVSVAAEVLLRSLLMSVSKPVFSPTCLAPASIFQHGSRRINVKYKDALYAMDNTV